MPCPSMVITLGTMDVGTEEKMLCHRKTYALHSKLIISSRDTWSTSYKQVSTILTMILFYNGCVCRLKLLDPTEN